MVAPRARSGCASSHGSYQGWPGRRLERGFLRVGAIDGGARALPTGAALRQRGSLQRGHALRYPAFVTTRFDRDTDVRKLDAPAGATVHEGRIDRGWWVVRGPNGGYVAALVLRALAGSVDPDRAPRSLTVHYTAPPVEGPVRIETRIERVGRSMSAVSGRMLQGDRVLALALGAFSKPRVGPSFDDTAMPDAPPPEACESFAKMIPIHERYDYRFAVGTPPGSGADRALIGGWIRSAEPRLADAALVAAFTDAWPPACFAWAKRARRDRPGADRRSHHPLPPRPAARECEARRLLPRGVPLALRGAGLRRGRRRGVESRRAATRAVAPTRRDRLKRAATREDPDAQRPRRTHLDARLHLAAVARTLPDRVLGRDAALLHRRHRRLRSLRRGRPAFGRRVPRRGVRAARVLVARRRILPAARRAAALESRDQPAVPGDAPHVRECRDPGARDRRNRAARATGSIPAARAVDPSATRHVARAAVHVEPDAGCRRHHSGRRDHLDVDPARQRRRLRFRPRDDGGTLPGRRTSRTPGRCSGRRRSARATARTSCASSIA